MKAENSQNISNYWPTSIIQHIITEQHGYVKGKSTITNLIIYSNHIANVLEDNKQFDPVYLDFSKVFDSVNHELLIFKLSKLGIVGKLLEWVESFISDREMSVRIKCNIFKYIQ